MWSADATIEVIKEVDSNITLSIEDASVVSNDKTQKFFAMLKADMNVVSLFSVDDNYATVSYESADPAPIHKNSSYLLRYRLTEDGVGGVKADVKLLRGENSLFSKTYFLKQDTMMIFLAHTIAYDINNKLGGTSMEWIKRKVLFIRLTGPRQSEIVAADYTLTYQQVLLSGGMFGFVKWANKEQTHLYFTSFSENRPTIYKMDIVSGKKTKLISSDGMAVCSDVNENSNKLLLTLAPDGQPDIYLYDLTNDTKMRITNYPGIDVNGQFMEDGSIAFVSNRFGYPNVFVTRPGSNAVNQLVFHGRNNSSLTSYKNFLVYKGRETNDDGSGNMFNLHLMSLTSGSNRRLTSSGENDYPKYSSDGEAILYIKQEKSRSSLGIIRLGINKSFAFPLRIGKIQSIDW